MPVCQFLQPARRLSNVSILIVFACFAYPLSALGVSSVELWLDSVDPPPKTPMHALSAPDLEEPGSTLDETRAARATTSHRITGSALRPRDSVVDFNINSTGACIYAVNNASDVFNTPIWLPQGTVIDRVRMYYNDTSTSNSRAWFTVYDLYGTIVDEWEVTSSGNSGNGFNDTPVIDHVVDYSNYSYLLNWRPVAAGTEMQLCGFRIFHTPPSPIVFQDRFE